MSNIPRRKIYEELLIFEEGILELERMNYNKEYYEEYKNNFKDYIEKIENSYYNIKALLYLFIENKKFENENDFESELNYFLDNKKELEKFIKKNKNFTNEFYNICKEVENSLKNSQISKINDLIFIFDKFNSKIPKMLEIKRNKIHK